MPKAYLPLVNLGRSKAGVGVVALASGYPVGPTGLIQIGGAIAGMTLGAFLVAVAAGSLVRSSLFTGNFSLYLLARHS